MSDWPKLLHVEGKPADSRQVRKTVATRTGIERLDARQFVSTIDTILDGGGEDKK